LFLKTAIPFPLIKFYLKNLYKRNMMTLLKYLLHL
jgi:poly(3-hydroxyalkanoate) synthetase